LLCQLHAHQETVNDGLRRNTTLAAPSSPAHSM